MTALALADEAHHYWLGRPKGPRINHQGPKKHIGISILWGYPYLIGLYYKGVYMGYALKYKGVHIMI